MRVLVHKHHAAAMSVSNQRQSSPLVATFLSLRQTKTSNVNVNDIGFLIIVAWLIIEIIT